MQLQLSEDESRTLLGLVNAYLPVLRREAAATELPSRELRDELARRIRLCERLMRELEPRAESSAR